MNAARPIMGTKTAANGPFLAGRFYAAIDPADERAASYVETNRSLDAHVVVQLTQDEQVDLILWQDDYESKYREEFEGQELFDVLRGRVSELNSLTFAGLQALREAVSEAAMNAAAGTDTEALAHMVMIAACVLNAVTEQQATPQQAQFRRRSTTIAQ
ncbi:hypothetical protein HZR81_19080 [Pseudomonas sp. LM13]